MNNYQDPPSIEEIDAQLAATSATMDGIFDEETHGDHGTEDDGGVHIETEMPPLPQTEPAPEALAEVPAFTPQDEQRELDSLTLQERMEL